jgi:2-haloacid dehalogenase
MTVKALAFDVFGTVVDWRSSIIAELEEFGRAHGVEANWEAMADGWRSGYAPAMDRVRRGELPWTRIDDLHRMILDELLAAAGITGVAEDDIDHLNRAWHRLDPWPDVVEGLTRLKKKVILAPCSNGNIALMVNMAKRAGLPWDCILGAETARAYKPTPEAYLAACRSLALPPARVMMVAAHNGDLKAAKAQGLATAFVPRPTEHGAGQKTDLAADPACVDLPVASFTELASRLGC